MLERRIAAGQFARDVQELRCHEAVAAGASAELDRLLDRLGFSDGELAGRLDRAIEAVNAARLRDGAATGVRTRADLEAQSAALAHQVQATRRLSWDLTPEPTAKPADPDLLAARRGEVSELLATSEGPDLTDAQRRLAIMQEREAALEARLDELAQGPTSRHKRVTDRVARSTWIGDHEESIPVFVDEALGDLSADERSDVLDLLARLSSRTQVVVLSNDPVVSGWARRNTVDGLATLLEADVLSAALVG